MKKVTTLLFLFLLIGCQAMAAKSYEMEVYNLVQVNETELTFDVRMRKTNASESFAIELIQWQFSFNSAIVNGGAFNNGYLTFVDGTTDLVGVIIPTSTAFTMSGSDMRWLTPPLDIGAQTTLFNDASWKRIGTFRMQLRNAENTAFNNFADAAHNIAFVANQVIVNECNYTIDGSGNCVRDGAGYTIISSKTLTNNLSTRELAGYYFSGTGNFETTARWNNITSANANTLPSAGSNAIISGAATVTDARTLNELTVSTGSYLVLNQNAQLTTISLYNDNVASGGGLINLSTWNFNGTTDNAPLADPYYADVTNANNLSFANLTTTASNAMTYTNAAYANGWHVTFGNSYKSWQVQLNTTGFQNLKLSSKQFSDISNSLGGGFGPNSFKVQWSTDNLNWTDVTGGTVIVAENWTTGVLTNLVLPSNIENQSSIYLRWLNTATSPGWSAIDDIVITGEPLPSGILIQSTSSGTGSLIQNTTGVEATVQRYIPAAVNWTTDATDGWHLLSSPVAAQAIDPEFTTSGGGEYDFYAWSEPEQLWKNQKISGNNITSFNVGQGYLVAYQNTGTKVFSGALNTANQPVTLTNNGGTYTGWNLLGNPYSSALTWGTGWTLTNIGGVAQIWNESIKDYTLINTGDAIPAMNGFMVYTEVASQSLTIPAAARAHSAAPWYKSSAERIKLTVYDTVRQSAKEAIMEFNTGATPDFDLAYDAFYLQGYGPEFYTVSEGLNYSLNALPQFTTALAVPLSFVKNETDRYYIELNESIAGEAIYLTDYLADTTVDLSAMGQYHFTAQDGDIPERFLIHFALVGTEELQAQPVTVYAYDKTLVINGLSEKTKVDVLNTAGQTVQYFETNAVGTQRFSLNLAAGIYVVKLSSQSVTSSTKVIIR